MFAVTGNLGTASLPAVSSVVRWRQCTKYLVQLVCQPAVEKSKVNRPDLAQRVKNNKKSVHCSHCLCFSYYNYIFFLCLIFFCSFPIFKILLLKYCSNILIQEVIQHCINFHTEYSAFFYE